MTVEGGGRSLRSARLMVRAAVCGKADSATRAAMIAERGSDIVVQNVYAWARGAADVDRAESVLCLWTGRGMKASKAKLSKRKCKTALARRDGERWRVTSSGVICTV